jgi:hypothetical protein
MRREVGAEVFEAMPAPDPNEPRINWEVGLLPAALELNRQGRWLKDWLQAEGFDVSPAAPVIAVYTNVTQNTVILDQAGPWVFRVDLSITT